MDDSDTTAIGVGSEVGHWLSKLEEARKDDGMRIYEERCHEIRKKYRYEGSLLIRTRKYQMLWSNIQTMQSAIYAKPPHAVVSRRFRDQDPVARTATEVLERAVNFTFDAADFDTEFKMVRDDFLLYARGVARIYYEPEYETEDDEIEDISDADDSERKNRPGSRMPVSSGSNSQRDDSSSGGASDRSEGGEPDAGGGSYEAGGGDRESRDSERKLKFENVRIRFVQRQDFRHQTARVWGEVQWVAFRAFMTRAEVKKRFGEKIGKDISLDADPMSHDEPGRESESSSYHTDPKAAVWEIWDKANNEVLWISPGYPDVLEVGAPYLDLDGFYPCPRPAYGTLTPDSLVPVPDYVFYEDQAAEINQLTARIGGLSDALKLVGFFAAGPQGEGAPEMEKAMTPGFENKIIAVPGNFGSFLEGSKSGIPLIWLPMDQIVETIKGCIELRKQLIEDVYQIIGISDIMRGATDPQETEGAQQLKAQYGGTRVKDRQTEIARFCRDIARLVGQVLAQYCSPKTIMEMTNMPLPTRAQQMVQKLMAAQQAMQQQQPPGPPQQPPGQAMPPARPPGVNISGGLPQGVPRQLQPIGGVR